MTVIYRKSKDKVVVVALSKSLIAVINSSDSWYSDVVYKVFSQPDDCVGFKVEHGRLHKFDFVRDIPFDSRFDWKFRSTIFGDPRDSQRLSRFRFIRGMIERWRYY